MDPEQTFLRVHARLSGMLLRVLTPRFRKALEYLHLMLAVALFCTLVIMHTNFVQQPGCSSELSGADIEHADLVHIKINSAGLWSRNPRDISNAINVPQPQNTAESVIILDVDGDGMPLLAAKYWLNWIFSGAKKSKFGKPWKNDKELADHQVDNSAEYSGSKVVTGGSESRSERDMLQISLSAKESFKAAVVRLVRKLYKFFSSLFRRATLNSFISWSSDRSQNAAGSSTVADVSKLSDDIHVKGFGSFIVQWLENRNKSFEPTYLYTVEKGYFWLSEDAKSRHNVRTVNLTISAQNSCFGNRWQQLLINSFVGYDTILMNSLLSIPGQGYLYNFQTKEIYDLSYAYEPAEGSKGFEDYFVTKCGVLIMSLFVFFTTTMSVSFTLRETQSRMLQFTAPAPCTTSASYIPISFCACDRVPCLCPNYDRNPIFPF